jgi:hypothetical protein
MGHPLAFIHGKLLVIIFSYDPKVSLYDKCRGFDSDTMSAYTSAGIIYSVDSLYNFATSTYNFGGGGSIEFVAGGADTVLTSSFPVAAFCIQSGDEQGMVNVGSISRNVDIIGRGVY